MNDQDLQLFKDGVIKDRRRRYLYLSKDKSTGKHIPERDLKKFNLLKSNQLLALLVFIVPYGIFRLDLVYSALAAIAVYGAMWFYLEFVLMKNYQVIKVVDADLEKTESLPYQESLQANALVNFMVSLSVLAIIIINQIQDGFNLMYGLFAIVLMIVVAGYMVLQGRDLLIYRKRVKALKTTSK